LGVSLGDLYLALRADDSGLKGDLDSAENKTKSWASGFATNINTVMRGAFERVGHLATDALVNVGRAAVGYVKESVDAASDLSESINKVSGVFTNNKAKILVWSKSSATALGQSRQQALEAAGTFGNLFDALGLTEDKSTDMSIGLVQLASDLASFNNISSDEALIKLRAGIVGETEPLRTLGVNLSAVAVEAYGLANGLVDANGEMSEQAKVAARYAIIMEQTKNAQGDFAATSDGLANSQRILKANWTDLSATVGTAVIPVVAEATKVLKDLASFAMPAVATFLEQNVTPAFERAAAGIKSLAENSAFKWTPEIKQVKLGDFFEFIKNDKLTYFNLAEYVSFVYNATTGAINVKIGDFFEFVRNGGITYLNLADYVSFVYNNESGAVDIKVGDLFSLSSGESGAQVNIADYVTFIYDNATGAIALKAGDLLTVVSDEGGTVINLADYVQFSYDNATGAVSLVVADLFAIVSGPGGTVVNLADYIVVTYGKEDKYSLKLGSLFEIEKDGEKQKVNVLDAVEITTGEDGKTVVDLSKFLEVDKSKIGKIYLSDFLPWMEGGEGEAPVIDIASFFSLEPESLPKATEKDVFPFIGEDGKFDMNALFAFDPAKVGKVTLGDIFPFLGDGVSFKISDVLTVDKTTVVFTLKDLFPFLGEDGTFDVSKLFSFGLFASSGFAEEEEKLNASMEPPTWLADLQAFTWPDLAEGTKSTFDSLVNFLWPDTPEEIGTLLLWVWPEAPLAIAGILKFLWPEFGSGLTSIINSIINFQWPKLERPDWIDALINFKIPTPGWVTALLSWAPPIPNWLKGSNVGDPPLDDPDYNSDGSFGGNGDQNGTLKDSSVGSVGNTVIIEQLIINNAQDIEEVVYKVTSRLAYGV